MSQEEKDEPSSDMTDDPTVTPNPMEFSASDQRRANTNESLVGSRLGGYLVLHRLGRGGMADVYSAKDTSLDRDVAVKVLRPDLARDREYITRFRREARAAAKLNHSNIVQIYEVGEDASCYYIAQELITGMNLRQMLDRNGAFETEKSIEVLFGVASALDAAATQGITHRDIKPENVMMSTSGMVKVADFGLARLGGDNDASRADLTQAGLTLGTPRYMSPEQVQGKPVDPRSDLYSLGVMMYHLLAGRPPFQADDALALAFSHVNETPEPLDRVRGDAELPEWLVAIVAKLMRKDPGERFQSPAELLEALTGDDSAKQGTQRFAGAATATARLQRVADEQKRIQRRKRFQYLLVASLPFLCAGAGVVAASSFPKNSVAEMLQEVGPVRPESVEKKETVAEQYLHAVEREDAASWKAVSFYFPPSENAVNRSYGTKSQLQLARFYLSQEMLVDAESTLEQVTRDPETAAKYLMVAWAEHVKVMTKMSKLRAASEAKRQYELLRLDMMDRNPDAVDWFDEVIPPRVQAEIGLPTVSDDDS